MSERPARKISISSQPPAAVADARSPPNRFPASRRDSDTDYLLRSEKAIAGLAAEVDKCLGSGGNLRGLIAALANDYEFMDREKFVREICERVEKFPETKHKVAFIVNIFAIYEYTGHQDLAVRCADFCIRSSCGSHPIASACSTLLCRIADNCTLIGSGPAACREAMERVLSISAGLVGNPFLFVRPVSEISTFCRSIRLKESDDSQPGVAIGALPLRRDNLFLNFLSALANVASFAAHSPNALYEFIASCMDMARAWRAELFVSAVSVLASAALLDAKENEKYVRETLLALQTWDQEYINCLEASLMKQVGIPQRR